jgi:hypothetical protein
MVPIKITKLKNREWGKVKVLEMVRVKAKGMEIDTRCKFNFSKE